MIKKIKTYNEDNKTLRTIEIVLMCFLLVASLFSFFYGNSKLNGNEYKNMTYVTTVELEKEEDSACDEDSTVCEITYSNDDVSLIKQYSDESEVSESIVAYEYKLDRGKILCFDHQDPTLDEVTYLYKQEMANDCAHIYNLVYLV